MHDNFGWIVCINLSCSLVKQLTFGCKINVFMWHKSHNCFCFVCWLAGRFFFYFARCELWLHLLIILFPVTMPTNKNRKLSELSGLKVNKQNNLLFCGWTRNGRYICKPLSFYIQWKRIWYRQQRNCFEKNTLMLIFKTLTFFFFI